MDLWHLNNMKIVVTLWTLKLLIVSHFVVLILSIFSIEPTNIKKSYSQLSQHHTSINLANIFDFIGQFLKYVGYGEIKWLCGFTKYTSYKFTTNTTIQVNELVLTPFSPFDFKCKKLNVKNLWKCICIFRASRRVSFSYFSNTALDHGGRTPPYFSKFMRVMLQHLVQALCNI